MTQTKIFPELEQPLAKIAAMTNADLPSDRRMREGCLMTAGSGRLLVDQTLSVDAYVLIDTYLQADDGMRDWLIQTSKEHPNVKRLISLVATPKGMMCRGHGLVGDIIADEESMRILTDLGKDAPGVPPERIAAMSPLAVTIYGVFGTIAYVDLYEKTSGFTSTIAQATRCALVSVFRNTDILVSLSTTTPMVGSLTPDIRFLGLTDYTITDGNRTRILPHEGTHDRVGTTH